METQLPSPPKRGRAPNFQPIFNGWMHQYMPHGIEVCLSPGEFVLDGDPSPLPPPIFGPLLLWPNGWMHQDAIWYGCRPQVSPLSPKRGGAPRIFGPCLLWPNGWMHQDATSYGDRPQPKGLCVRWGPSPRPKKEAEPPIFGPCLLWPNGRVDQDGTWHGGRPWSSPHCAIDGDTYSFPPKKGGIAPNFQPIFIVGKRLDASICHLVRR